MLGPALERPPSERRAYVAQACGDDDELQREVERLLDLDTSAADVYDRPVFDFRTIPEPQAPDRIAGFEVVRKIGEGGMSRVYLATPAEGDDPRPVAIKVLRHGPAREETIRRFRREGEILAGLRHPHIVALRGGGVLEDGRPYLVMPYIDGQPVDRFCRDLDLRHRLRLFLKICEAVQHAHRSLVVHRDLKPSNILVTADGEPRLLDFGIAKLLDPATDLSPTRTRADLRMLTPAYAAPEQIAGAPASTLCDVYALGTLLFELLADRRPFAAGAAGLLTESAQLAAKCERDPPRPSDRVDASAPDGRQRKAQLRGDLDAITLQAIARRPEDRYDSVERLASDLRRHLEHRPVEARPAGWAYRTGKFMTRHRVGLGVAVVIALALAAITFERERQRWKAEQAVERSERVKTFLTTLLEEAEPFQGSGLDVPLRQVLASSSRRLTDLADEPAVQSELMLLLGSIYLNLAEPELASPLLEAGLEVRRETFGPFDPQSAESLCALGRRDLLVGDLDAAGERLDEAIEILRDARSQGRQELAYCLNELANVYERRPRLDDAEAAYREAYGIALDEHGASAPPTLVYGLNLATLLWRKGNLEPAEALFLELIDRLEEAPVSAAMGGLALSNLAVLRFGAGRTEGAESAFREALRVYRQALGPGHPKTLVALANLSFVLRDRGSFDEARSLLQERLELAESMAGESSPAVANALEDLAALEHRLGLLDSAESHLRRSLELNRQTQGAEHPRVATVANVLGSVLLSSGRPSEALEWFESALGLRLAAYGEDNLEAAISLANRGRASVALGRFEAAHEDLDLAFERVRGSLGEGHWHTALMAAWRARALRLSGSPEAARESLAPFFERFAAAAIASPTAEQIRQEWAVQDLEAGQDRAAAQALAKTLERIEPAYGRHHPWLAEIRLLLAEASVEGDPAAADQLLEAVRRDWPPHWGDDHWRRHQVAALDALAKGASGEGSSSELRRLTAGTDPIAAATARRLVARAPR